MPFYTAFASTCLLLATWINAARNVNLPQSRNVCEIFIELAMEIVEILLIFFHDSFHSATHKFHAKKRYIVCKKCSAEQNIFVQRIFDKDTIRRSRSLFPVMNWFWSYFSIKSHHRKETALYCINFSINLLYSWRWLHHFLYTTNGLLSTKPNENRLHQQYSSIKRFLFNVEI